MRQLFRRTSPFSSPTSYHGPSPLLQNRHRHCHGGSKSNSNGWYRWNYWSSSSSWHARGVSYCCTLFLGVGVGWRCLLTPVFAADSTKSSQNTTLEARNYEPSIQRGGMREFYTMAHVTAPKEEADSDAKKTRSLDITAVMDVSGSMTGKKLDMAKEALKFVVKELGPNDRFGLVKFNSSVRVVLPLTSIETDGSRATTSVDSLYASGTTNLSGGLFAGLDTVVDRSTTFRATSSESESTRVVLLFTDGEANVGITDPAELTSATRRKLDGLEKDATVFTFGFGADHNATLLKGLAEISQGTYYYVQNAAQMPEIFGDCLGGLQSIVAQKLNLRMKPAPGVKVKEVMTAYPSSVDRRTGTASVQMKDLYSEEQRDVVVRLEVDMATVDPDATKDTACLCEWTLSCLNTLTDKAEVVSAALPVTVANEPFTGNCDLKVDEQINRFKVTTEMEKARRLADAGNVAGARACLALARDECRKSQSHNSDLVQALQRDLEQSEAHSVTAAAWASEGQKLVSQMETCHKQQRSNYSSTDEAKTKGYLYSNESKRQARSRAAQL